MPKKKEKTSESFEFSTETSKILQLMIHSLYGHKEIFLRELISNASDACDKLRYQTLTNPELLKNDKEMKINISVNPKENTLTVRDNGIGMNKADLIDNLGIIARSGTENFALNREDIKKGDINLIGQFGVGFYSAFMVAQKVVVLSNKAGEDDIWEWSSEADGKYTIEKKENNPDFDQGSMITLHLKEDEKEFTDKHRIEHIVKTYSNHIPFPVTYTDEEGIESTINQANALWLLPKKDIKEEEYSEFYKSISHMMDKPWMTLHNKIEGTLEYTNLLFIPSSKPFDLFNPDRLTRVRLYVKRVFISEENLDLIPRYLRFVQGIIDSEDLPLNVSRETLQHNATIKKIRKSITKRILSELKKKSVDAIEEYSDFWNNFGAVIKEGLCEQNEENRELIMEICRFHSIKSDSQISLDSYLNNMNEKQKSIYYLTGDDIETLKNSPQLEGFKKHNIDVLLLSDSVDDFWLTTNHEYKGTEFISATRSGIDLNKDQDEDSEEEDKSSADKKENKVSEEMSNVITFMKDTLKNKVSDVVISKKLTDTPACISIQEGAMNMRMERFLVSQGQMPASSSKIFEINEKHPIIEYIKLNKDKETDKIKDITELLFDQACIIEGEKIQDAVSFSKKLNNIINLAIKS